MKIGEYEVMAISKEAVKVGCQTVTAADAEAVLGLMRDYEEPPNYRIVGRKSAYPKEFIEFSIFHRRMGWVSTDDNGEGTPRLRYNHRAVDFCLGIDGARKLRDFLNSAGL